MSGHELPDAGDFARVVDGCPCGGTAETIGDIELVLSINGPDWACDCPVCGRQFMGPIANVPSGNGDCYPLEWLRKIDPPAELLDEIAQEAAADDAATETEDAA